MLRSLENKIREKITYRLCFEFIALVIVFSLSLNYSLNKEITYLVGDCSDCSGNCIAFNTVKSGTISNTYDLNLFMENQNGVNYSYSILSGQFTSCELTNPAEFEQQWYIGVDNTIEIVSSEHKISPDYDNAQRQNFTLSAKDCFQLDCSVQNMIGHNPVLGYLVIPEVSVEKRSENIIRIFGQIFIKDTSVIANCYVNINDVLFPFLTASNTFTQSDVLKCEMYPNILDSFGVSLTYVLTSLSVIKSIRYLESQFNK